MTGPSALAGSWHLRTMFFWSMAIAPSGSQPCWAPAPFHLCSAMPIIKKKSPPPSAEAFSSVDTPLHLGGATGPAERPIQREEGVTAVPLDQALARMRAHRLERRAGKPRVPKTYGVLHASGWTLSPATLRLSLSPPLPPFTSPPLLPQARSQWPLTMWMTWSPSHCSAR
jgi:hypothetical protein